MADHRQTPWLLSFVRNLHLSHINCTFIFKLNLALPPPSLHLIIIFIKVIILNRNDHHSPHNPAQLPNKHSSFNSQKKKKKKIPQIPIISCPFLTFTHYPVHQIPFFIELSSPKWTLPGKGSHCPSGSPTSLFLRRRTCLTDISPADFAESRLTLSGPSSDPVPCLAYLISGSAEDGESLKRTLRAIYRPRNQYVLHLDLEASALERLDSARFVEGHPLFSKVGNVRMNVRANLVTYRGPTMVSDKLHVAAILLREGGDWDWFINLSASDYPLVTQDGNTDTDVM